MHKGKAYKLILGENQYIFDEDHLADMRYSMAAPNYGMYGLDDRTVQLQGLCRKCRKCAAEFNSEYAGELFGVKLRTCSDIGVRCFKECSVYHSFDQDYKFEHTVLQGRIYRQGG